MKLDHIVYAVPDLAAGIAEITKRFGVVPTAGGQHVGFGTRNVLVALGDDCYLEIIGPDPAQPNPTRQRPFSLDTLSQPKLMTWAVKASNLEEKIAQAQAAGYDPGPVVDMSRAKPDGTLLAWRLTMRPTTAGDGLVPFMIDWGDTIPVAQTIVQGCQLVELKGQHPNPGQVQKMLQALGVDLAVERADTAALTAVIDTPNGRVKLS